MASNKIRQAVPDFFPVVINNKQCPILTVVSERGTFVFEVHTLYLLTLVHVPKTAAREATECNRYFPAAVLNGLIRSPIGG